MIDRRFPAVRSALVLVSGLVAACAQPSPPPGGPQDRDAPRVDSTRPVHGAIVPELDGSVVFFFDEKLGERGARDAVMVSPETGLPVLERDGSELKVHLEGGWKPNTVYRVIITPGIQDRFGNPRREPAEVVFSTGPPLLPTAIAGLVTDRLTGRPVAEARVVALSADSVPHSTVTDTAGFFGLRFLPIGSYQVFAYEDQNRNRQLEYREKQSSQNVTLSAADTQVVTFEILARDSTPARLLRAESRDSVEVRLFFDDYIDPAVPLGQALATLYLLPDSSNPIAGTRLMHERDFEAQRPTAPPDTSRAAPARPPGVPGAPAVPTDTVRRPTQQLVLITGTPLQPGSRYQVRVNGVTNIVGIPNGGGTVNFATRARTARDTANVRRDTTNIRRDTTQHH